MQFQIKRDTILKSLTEAHNIIERKNTIPILANVLLQIKNNILNVIATDLDIIFHDQISDLKIENDGSTITKFLLKKQVRVESGNITTEKFTFGTSEKYSQIKLGSTDVIEILSCTDSDNNKWYEVDSLATDTIFEDMENNSVTDPTSVVNRDVAPYILKLKKT